jgi:hypothetical protein
MMDITSGLSAISRDEDDTLLSTPPSITRRILNPEMLEIYSGCPPQESTISTRPVTPIEKSDISYLEPLDKGSLEYLCSSWAERRREINTLSWNKEVHLLLKEILHTRKGDILEQLSKEISLAHSILDMCIPIYKYKTTTYHKDRNGNTCRFKPYETCLDCETYIHENGYETYVKGSTRSVDMILTNTNVKKMLESAFSYDHFIVTINYREKLHTSAFTTFDATILLQFYPNGIKK